MERAAGKLFKSFKKLFKRSQQVAVFAGPGNNGGDGLALARLLINDDFSVRVYLLTDTKKMSPDCKANYDRLLSIGSQPQIIRPDSLPPLDDYVVVDAIFGSGLSRPAEGLYGKVISHINQSHCTIFSVDIPSGLFCESNLNNSPESIVHASFTISFQVPKMAFLFSENAIYTGHVIIEDIGLLQAGMDSTESPYRLTDQNLIAKTLRPRQKFAHKGTFGHALLFAGSIGKMGAAVLASRACLKSGAGLLTTHVPHCGYNILQSSVPEAMACTDRSEYHMTELPDLKPYSAIGIGPGINTKPNTGVLLKDLIENCSVPLVIDADALNILALQPALLERLPKNTILTPHPGEFSRLFGNITDGFLRIQKQIEMSAKLNVVIILKGAHTSVTLPDGSCFFNTTGNPGMATAGSGDVLTGMVLALLAQGYPAKDAAIIATWLHGKAADIYIKDQGMETLTASDITDSLGKAFAIFGDSLQKGYYF